MSDQLEWREWQDDRSLRYDATGYDGERYSMWPLRHFGGDEPFIPEPGERQAWRVGVIRKNGALGPELLPPAEGGLASYWGSLERAQQAAQDHYDRRVRAI